MACQKLKTDLSLNPTTPIIFQTSQVSYILLEKNLGIKAFAVFFQVFNIKIFQWQQVENFCLVYVTYRWIIALIFLTTLILSIMDLQNPNTDRRKWIIYLTHWGYTTCTFQAILAALLSSSFPKTNDYLKCIGCFTQQLSILQLEYQSHIGL